MQRMNNSRRTLACALLVATALGVAGCGSSNGSASYMVTVTNLTHGQPLSPAIVVLHAADWSAWQIGTAAGASLETLAEGGDNGGLLAEATAAGAVSAGLDGLLMPGDSASAMIRTTHRSQRRLTVAGMLVVTNDAFSGIASADLSGLARGDSITWHTHVYDAGTETNSETAATVPALGGTGFAAARDDRADTVTGHPGVVTADDGLTTSDLDETHRFDNPALAITVVRL